VNIVVTVVDTLRYDHAFPAGDSPVETPNLDRFAARSWRFDSAFTSSFPTIPTRQDMLLGRGDAPFHGWSPLDCTARTLPDVLADAGYATQLIHDTPHLVNGGFRFDYPFHAWTPVRGAECDRPWFTDDPVFPDNWAYDDRFDGYGIEREKEAVLAGSKATLRNYVYAHRDRETEADWNVARLFETAAEFLRDNADRENFFLWLDCFDPHEPWDAPPSYVREYERDPDADGRIDPRSFHDEVYDHPDLSAAASEHKVAQYRAKLAFVDRWFGRFLDTLEETGLLANTAVVVLGDHGTNLADDPRPNGNRFGKTAPPAENEAHVPLAVYAPDAGSGRCETPVQLTDVFATVAGLAGADVPAGRDSVDLLAVADGDTTATRSRDIAVTGTHVSGWADADADDVLCYAYDGEWCLGLTADPDAAVLRPLGGDENVAADHPEVVDRLRTAAVAELDRRGLDDGLVAWLNAAGDRPVPDEYEGREGAGPDWFAPYFTRPIPD
jgi:arylsulfatase A-like enzyme